MGWESGEAAAEGMQWCRGEVNKLQQLLLELSACVTGRDRLLLRQLMHVCRALDNSLAFVDEEYPLEYNDGTVYDEGDVAGYDFD
jgi:hypothetical protein